MFWLSPYFKSINFRGLDHFCKRLYLQKFQISKTLMFWDRLSIQHTWIVFFFQMSVGSDSDLNENDKDLCKKMKLTSVRKFLKMFLIYLMNFLKYQTLILPLKHHILISVPIWSTNLFFQLTNQFKDGPKKKRARTQVKKSEKNARKYAVLPPCKESWSKRCITNFSSDDRALINNRSQIRWNDNLNGACLMSTLRWCNST